MIDQQVKKRQAITATENQTVQVIQGQISVINSNANLLISELLASGMKESSQIVAQADGEGDAAIMKAEAEAYAKWRDDGWKEEELMQFFYMKNVNLAFFLKNFILFRLFFKIIYFKIWIF